MPAFQFQRIPSVGLYRKVLGLFGLTTESLLTSTFVPDITDSLFEELSMLRSDLRAVYRRTDWNRCIPENWTRRTAIQILRHFLRSRHILLKSKIVRVNNKPLRQYSCEKSTAPPLVNRVVMATRLSKSRPDSSELFE